MLNYLIVANDDVTRKLQNTLDDACKMHVRFLSAEDASSLEVLKEGSELPNIIVILDTSCLKTLDLLLYTVPARSKVFILDDVAKQYMKPIMYASKCYTHVYMASPETLTAFNVGSFEQLQEIVKSHLTEGYLGFTEF